MARPSIWLILLLATSAILAGCTAPVDDQPTHLSCEEEHDIPEGHGWAIIFIDRPKNVRQLGFLSFWVEPELVAWKGTQGINEANRTTRDYIGLSVNEQLDWTVPTQIWYSEAVPKGNYSFIRFQVPEPIIAQRSDGYRPDVEVRGGQLTYQMEDDRVPFMIEEGKCTHMAFSARVVVPGVTSEYEVESDLRDV